MNQDIKSRITYSATLMRLNNDDMEGYIVKELERARMEINTFDPAAIELILRSAQGNFRLCRNLCYGSLVEAAREAQRIVTITHVLVAEHFDWMLTLDRAKIAKKLNDLRPATQPPLKVCIQVNISEQASKPGISLSEIDSLVQQVADLPKLEVRGLMAIPDGNLFDAELRHQYLQLKQSFERLSAQYPSWDTLSLGMSGDLDTAVACGSTLLRIGTAIFGEQEY